MFAKTKKKMRQKKINVYLYDRLKTKSLTHLSYVHQNKLIGNQRKYLT